MHNLKDTTFIIPIKIDSQDRLNNANTVLGYLNKRFNTNAIIHEIKDESDNRLSKLITKFPNLKKLKLYI